jgi:hypothetical protein
MQTKCKSNGETTGRVMLAHTRLGGGGRICLQTANTELDICVAAGNGRYGNRPVGGNMTAQHRWREADQDRLGRKPEKCLPISRIFTYFAIGQCLWDMLSNGLIFIRKESIFIVAYNN